MRSFRIISWALVVMVLIGLFFYVIQQNSGALQAPDKEGVGKALIGGPFHLIDQKGRERTPEDFKNKYLLVYFGYSYCPDICPTGLAGMTEALNKLGGKADRLQPLFISVDPERDTPETLTLYMQNFHPKFLALTGSKEEVEAAKKAYKVYATKVDPAKTGTTDYLMDHSSIVYLMSPRGEFLTHFNHQTPAEEMAKVISHYLK